MNFLTVHAVSLTPMGSRQHRVIFNLSHIGKALQSVHVFDLLYRAFIQNTALYEFLNFFKKTLAFFV